MINKVHIYRLRTNNVSQSLKNFSVETFQVNQYQLSIPSSMVQNGLVNNANCKQTCTYMRASSLKTVRMLQYKVSRCLKENESYKINLGKLQLLLQFD